MSEASPSTIGRVMLCTFSLCLLYVYVTYMCCKSYTFSYVCLLLLSMALFLCALSLWNILCRSYVALLAHQRSPPAFVLMFCVIPQKLISVTLNEGTFFSINLTRFFKKAQKVANKNGSIYVHGFHWDLIILTILCLIVSNKIQTFVLMGPQNDVLFTIAERFKSVCNYSCKCFLACQ